jgi:hypothetical protein
MARTRQPEPAPQAPQGFVASAVRLPTISRRAAGQPQEWQARAWNYWANVGELRFTAQWIGNVLSRARLVAAKREGRMLVPIEGKDPAVEAMDALYGGPQGQSQMLSALGINMTVAGEGYIINLAKDDTWHTLATGRVTQLGPKVLQANFGVEGDPRRLTAQDLVIRLFTPTPTDPTMADSPTRAVLSSLGQIVAYDAHINAQITSRLAGNGILFMSNEVDFPAGPNDDPNSTPAQRFMSMLGTAMMTPIEDPSDPSALVPIVAMVPTDALGKNEHMKFWSDLDEAVIQMRDAAIKRFALGMDVPPEVLLGLADQNHWNAWLSEESAVKAHLEPRLGVIAHALTEQYLRLAIKGQVKNPEDYFVLADTSSIRMRPNRSTEALALYDKGELSGEALRRETGFQPEDKPDDTAFKQWLLRQIATATSSPEQSLAALKELGIDLGVTAISGENGGRADQLRLDTQADLPERRPPDRLEREARQRSDESRVFSGPLAAACNVLVYRALERAGNKLKNMHPRTDMTDVQAAAAYMTVTGDPDALLAGAWSCAEEVLSPYTDDVAGVVDTLDFYVRGLLASRRAPSEVVLSALIDSRPAPFEIGA